MNNLKTLIKVCDNLLIKDLNDKGLTMFEAIESGLECAFCFEGVTPKNCPLQTVLNHNGNKNYTPVVYWLITNNE